MSGYSCCRLLKVMTITPVHSNITPLPFAPHKEKKHPNNKKKSLKGNPEMKWFRLYFFYTIHFSPDRPLTFNSLVLLLSHFLLIQSSGILPASPKAYSLIRNELPPWQTSVEPEPNLVSGRVTFRFYVRCLRSTFLSGRIFRGLILV